MESIWTPNTPEYYFYRGEMPILPEYAFITEKLSDDEIKDFRQAIFSDYWMEGKCPDMSKMTSNTIHAFYDYAHALARYCGKTWKKYREEHGIKAPWEVENAEQDH